MADFLTMQRVICRSHNPCERAATNNKHKLLAIIQGAANCNLLQMQITHNLTKIGCGCDSDYAVHIVCET